MSRSSERPLDGCRIAFIRADLGPLRIRLVEQGAHAVSGDTLIDLVDHVASGRADVAVGSVADAAATLLPDALAREMVVLVTQQWADCPVFVLARDVSAVFRVADSVTDTTPGAGLGLCLAGLVIADLTPGPDSDSAVLRRFRRKLVESGLRLASSPDREGCIGAIFSATTSVRVLLDSSPFAEVLGICCHDPRELPTGVAYVRLRKEAPGLAAMARAFTAIAAFPEAVERRWIS